MVYLQERKRGGNNNKGEMEVFTYDEDIDLIILSFVPDGILHILVTTCTYLWKLHSDLILWKRKIQRLHPGILLPDNSNYHHLYHHAIFFDHVDFHEVITSPLQQDMVRWIATALSQHVGTLLLYLSNSRYYDLILLAYQLSDRSFLRDFVITNALNDNRMDIVEQLILLGVTPSSISVSDKDKLQWAVKHLNYTLSISTANTAALNGNLPTLVWLRDDHHILPNQVGTDCAAGNGHLEVMKWIFTNTNLTPSHKGRDDAIINNYLEVVKWIYQMNGNTTVDIEIIHSAIDEDSVDTVKWLIMLMIGGGYIVNITDTAVSAGAVNIVKWLLESGYKPEQRSVDHAATNGYPDMVELLGSKGIYPSNHVVDKVCPPIAKWMAANRGIWPSLVNVLIKTADYDMCDWLVQEGKILTKEDITRVVSICNIRKVKWLYSRYPCYKLSGDDIPVNTCVTVELWEFFLRLELYPTQQMIDEAIIGGNTTIIKLLLDYHRYPSQGVVDMMALRDEYDIVVALGNRGLYPSQSAVDTLAVQNERSEVLNWLVHDVKIYPIDGLSPWSG